MGPYRETGVPIDLEELARRTTPKTSTAARALPALAILAISVIAVLMGILVLRRLDPPRPAVVRVTPVVAPEAKGDTGGADDSAPTMGR